MATQTAKSKLPNLQAPQPRRTIPNSQPLESQTDHQRDRPISGQEPQQHQPRTQPSSWPSWLWRRTCLRRGVSERTKSSRNACRVDPKVWFDADFNLGIQWKPEQIAGQVRVRHENVFCMYVPTKPQMVIYTGTFAANRPDENVTYAGVTDVARFPTVASSATDPATSKIASK